MESILVYLLAGAVAGMAAGLLGVGGGLIIVPALVWQFAAVGLPEQYRMHLAIGTSLATIILTSLSSLRAHHRRGAVLWEVVREWLPGLLFGALAGVLVASALQTQSLRRLFGVFELLVAMQLLTGLKPRVHRGLPGRWGNAGLGFVTGSVSSLLGIGGGTLTVPMLLWCGVGIRHAIATSAACGLPIAVAGTLAFVFAGWGRTELPSASLGFVYLPAFMGIAVVSMLTAPLGARLAHSLPIGLLRRGFGVFLLLVGAKMLLAE